MGDLISRSGLFKAWDALDETQVANLLIDAMIKAAQDAPAVDAEPVITGETSDGYHTFNELYELYKVAIYLSKECRWIDVGNLLKVTHWMPIPELPKECKHVREL